MSPSRSPAGVFNQNASFYVMSDVALLALPAGVLPSPAFQHVSARPGLLNGSHPRCCPLRSATTPLSTTIT